MSSRTESQQDRRPPDDGSVRGTNSRVKWERAGQSSTLGPWGDPEEWQPETAEEGDVPAAPTWPAIGCWRSESGAVPWEERAVVERRRGLSFQVIPSSSWWEEREEEPKAWRDPERPCVLGPVICARQERYRNGVVPLPLQEVWEGHWQRQMPHFHCGFLLEEAPESSAAEDLLTCSRPMRETPT